MRTSRGELINLFIERFPFHVPETTAELSGDSTECAILLSALCKAVVDGILRSEADALLLEA